MTREQVEAEIRRILATETSAVTFLSVPGVAFNPNGGNLTFLQLAFGYVIGRAVVACFVA